MPCMISKGQALLLGPENHSDTGAIQQANLLVSRQMSVVKYKKIPASAGHGDIFKREHCGIEDFCDYSMPSGWDTLHDDGDAATMDRLFGGILDIPIYETVLQDGLTFVDWPAHGPEGVGYTVPPLADPPCIAPRSALPQCTAPPAPPASAPPEAHIMCLSSRFLDAQDSQQGMG